MGKNTKGKLLLQISFQQFGQVQKCFIKRQAARVYDREKGE